MLKTLIRTSTAAAALVFPLAACGGGSSSGGVDPATANVKVHALDSLKFDQTEYTAHAGDVVFAEIDDGTQPHTLLIDGHGPFKLSISGHGDTKAGKVSLAEGTYTIYCDIPTHRESGMEAKLIVTAAPPSSAASASGN